ncbi:MAG TPA: aspartate-semialdehyde dehydrogenase [Gammaproteobacteria bacterium]|nr:aspartate-semialdehyde dehydrogenase [Gammaproteobacteria bacterium]
MKKSYDIAIVGATGIVGTTTLSILEERNFPINKIFLLASKRSLGDALVFKGKSYPIEDLAEFDFSQTQICFFCTGNNISAEYAPKAAKLGNIVIDKSSHFRYEKNVPLIVPEVNESAIKNFKKTNIIANPNCSTIPILVALKPIYDAAGISRINIATYQSVSGSGKDAVTELAEQTALLLNGKPIKPKVYSQQIAFNILPHCDELEENGYTREEMKIIWETQKILNDKKIAVNPTAVRVPVFFGHSAAVHIETQDKISLKQALDLLSNASGIKLMTGKNQYPSPVHDAAGKDEVYVGRVREDLSHKKGLNMWVVTDNLRKGAALNAVQIAEQLHKKYL